MDTLAIFTHPECLLLLLEQGERPLEGHTRLFLEIAYHTSYPDALCTFYDASLNTVYIAPSSKDGPREDFTSRAQPTITITEPEPAAAERPLLHGVKELRITVEPELFVTSDQVRELATTTATREKAMDSKSSERSSAHCTMTE
ncbi:hypothetical protein M9458_013473, partial [Cirrhinus mrigala]